MIIIINAVKRLNIITIHIHLLCSDWPPVTVVLTLL